MAKEIERKFLVTNTEYQDLATSARHIVQGYLSRRPESTVRVRIIDGREAFITVKGRNVGAVRNEWEYPVPVADARQMLECCDGEPVEKTRFVVPDGGLTWEVDVFHGSRQGLVVAEVELSDADQLIDLPLFVGREVTSDPQYYNSNL